MCSTLVFHRLSSTSSRQKQSDDTAPQGPPHDGLRQTDWTFFSVVKVDRAQTVLSHSIESRTALHVVAVRCNSSPVNNNSCFRSISWCIKAANSSSYWEKEIEMNEWKCFGTMWIVLYSYKCIHALFIKYSAICFLWKINAEHVKKKQVRKFFTIACQWFSVDVYGSENHECAKQQSHITQHRTSSKSCW